MEVAELKFKLQKFPRVKFLCGATPIVYAENISKELGVEVYIKRDDLTGLALGGNKTRKLEFIMGEAIKQKCDTVITAGAVHSNHALQTAAAAKKLNMDVVLVLRGREEDKGNLLMNKLLNADIHIYDVPNSSALRGYMEEIAGELSKKGKKPMIIPVGGSNPIGVLGYLGAVVEIIEQCENLKIDFDYVVCSTSSGGTQAGIFMGFKLLKPEVATLCIGVGDPKEELVEDVENLIINTSKMLDVKENLISKKEIEERTIDGYGFGGYGTIAKEVIDFIRYVAGKEGFYLDPVYTGKAFYGLIDIIKKKNIPKGSRVLFIHTGGLGGLFQYEEIISKMILNYPES